MHPQIHDTMKTSLRLAEAAKLMRSNVNDHALTKNTERLGRSLSAGGADGLVWRAN